MEKINRLRIANQIGEIAIPACPLRQIKNNDVYDVVVRALEELRVVTGDINSQRKSLDINPGRTIENETNYILLSEISKAIDPLLGGYRFAIDDVYLLAACVFDDVSFIRFRKNLPAKVADLGFDMSISRHSNHVLREIYNLLEKISITERNLGIDPCEIPILPYHRIEFDEVYDAMQDILAEIQFIKSRLGIEYCKTMPYKAVGKTHNDVIYKLKQIQNILPTFDGTYPLTQKNKQ